MVNYSFKNQVMADAKLSLTSAVTQWNRFPQMLGQDPYMDASASSSSGGCSTGYWPASDCSALLSQPQPGRLVSFQLEDVQLDNGQVVPVLYAARVICTMRLAQPGYLDLSEHEEIHVIYEGRETHEIDWSYGKKTCDGQLGWFLRKTVKACWTHPL